MNSIEGGKVSQVISLSSHHEADTHTQPNWHSVAKELELPTAGAA